MIRSVFLESKDGWREIFERDLVWECVGTRVQEVRTFAQYHIMDISNRGEDRQDENCTTVTLSLFQRMIFVILSRKNNLLQEVVQPQEADLAASDTHRYPLAPLSLTLLFLHLLPPPILPLLLWVPSLTLPSQQLPPHSIVNVLLCNTLL